MKFASIFLGALATLASAAPTAEEKRALTPGGFDQFNTGVQYGTSFDVATVNNFTFQNLHLAYLAAFNGFRSDVFSQLVVSQNLAFEPFAEVFSLGGGQGFIQLNHILTLQSALVVSWMANAGLLNGASFGGGAIPLIDFGTLGGFVSPLSQFKLGVDQAVTTQITTFVQNTGRKFWTTAGGITI